MTDARQLPAASRPATTAHERLVEVVDNLPTLPEVALRVIQVVGRQDYEMAELVRIVRTDPALTTRILKLCNSSLFALRTPVTSVDAALPFLGARNLLKVVVSTCTREFFRDTEAGYLCRSGELWRHSVACALAGWLIASDLGFEDPGTAFTAGVLHNVGKVAVAPILASESARLARRVAEDEALDFLTIERELVGMDHAAVGEMVTRRWPLPTELQRSIVHHHDPERIEADPPLTAVVHIADLLCLQLGIGVGIDGLRYSVAAPALTRTGLHARHLDGLRARLLVEVRRHEELINMDGLADR